MNQEKSIKKKKIPRCSFTDVSGNKCKKKLKISDFPCRCEKTYCNKHRLPEYHNCIVNYKEIDKNKILSCVGGGKYKKIEVI